jgi:crotonobetainyl-CoA:carnitine CoA-transferase CaiB-like acyl-CoA transferase
MPRPQDGPGDGGAATTVEVLGSPLGPLGAHGRDLPPPGLGAHTREVLTTQLGLSAADVDRLVADGALVDGA